MEEAYSSDQSGMVKLYDPFEFAYPLKKLSADKR